MLRFLLSVPCEMWPHKIYYKNLPLFKHCGCINNQAIEINSGEIRVIVSNTYVKLLGLSPQTRQYCSNKEPKLIAMVKSEMNEVISQYQ